MTVYVDGSIYLYGSMKMCHMTADMLAELHMMADRIGVARRWFQGNHYDICKSKRALAVQYDAREVSRRDIVMALRRLREEAG